MTAQTSAFDLDVGGVRIACDRYGAENAPPMVMLHAADRDASTWSEIAPAPAASHCVYALDLRGHGRGDWPGTYSFELMRDDVLGFPSSHVPRHRIAEAAAILPNARLLEIPVGHRIHGERPAEFLAAVAKFVMTT